MTVKELKEYLETVDENAVLSFKVRISIGSAYYDYKPAEFRYIFENEDSTNLEFNFGVQS